jgi:hypothetical protein
MALVGPTLLCADPDTSNVASYVSPSVSPTAGAGILVFVSNSDAADAIRPTLSSAFSITGSWTDEGSIQQAALTRRLTLFSAYASGSPGSGAITADFGGDAQTGCIIIAVEYTGQHATDFTAQPASIADAAGEVGESLSLAAPVASGSQMIAAFYHAVNEAHAAVVGTMLASSDVGYATPAARVSVHHITNANTVECSWTTTSSTLGIGIEVIEAASGGTDHTVTVDDTVSLSDALPITQGKAIDDTLALTDAQALERGLGLADTLSLADALAIGRSIVVTDTLALADNVLAELNGGGGGVAVVPWRTLMGVGV